MPTYYPNISRYRENLSNYLWISITPMELSYTGIESLKEDKSQIGIEGGSEEDEMMFLAPMSLQDSIQHNWEPMENILSRFQDKFAALQKEASFSTDQHKVDTALLYQDSDRRNIQFTVYLAAHSNPQEEVMVPINLLRMYSSPNLAGKEVHKTKVGNPYIFKLHTKTGEGKKVPLLNIEKAALLAVAPTFQGPYIGGMPSYCELTLSFKDMQPLSRKSFDNINSKVSVG